MEKLGEEIKKQKMELSFQASNSYKKLYITKIESLQLMHTTNRIPLYFCN